MAGIDTFRGIGYQQAQAVHLALDIIESGEDWTLRVEGITDVVDIEVFTSSGSRASAYQAKTRAGSAWTPKPIIDVFDAWLAQPDDGATFTFVTDQALGPGAQTFADALESARSGDLLPLTEIVGPAKAARLTRGHVRVAPDSVGGLLAAADRRAAALMDPLIRETSPLEAGVGAVNALFRLLTDRAGLADPAARLVTSKELRDIVGGVNGQPAGARWPEELQAVQLHEALQTELDVIEMRLRRFDGDGEVSAHAIIDSGMSILSGGTGSGKSSMCELLHRDAARDGRTVLVGRAETYLAGRLDTFAADALGFVIGRALPPSTGRQLLADSNVTLIIDGSSEVPDALRLALAADLRVLLNRPAVANIVLVGRDLAAMHGLVPNTTPVSRFVVRPLDDAERSHLAASVLGGAPEEADLERVLRQADRQLHDGAHNPFLLTLYLRTIADLGAADLSRSQVYAAFLEALAARTSDVDLRPAVVVLAHLFAELLARERRYSDEYEWVKLTDELAKAHPEMNTDGAQVRRAALRSGIVNYLGHTGTVAPFHDSIADYLAGRAHASGVAATPPRLTQTDEQWLSFAAEQRPAVAGNLSTLIVRDVPFAARGIAAHDEGNLDPSELAARTEVLLRQLVGDDRVTVTITELRDGRRRVATSAVTTQVIVDFNQGALFAAVRLWRIVLAERLSAPYATNTPRPDNADSARGAVELFATDRRRAMHDVLDLFPPSQRTVLTEAVGPFGLRAEVGAQVDDDRGRDWSLTYWPDPAINVTVDLATQPSTWDGGRSSVLSFCSGGPKHAASKKVSSALEQLVGRTGWLA